MCFVSSSVPQTTTTNPTVAADTAEVDELNRRRKARGYGATLLTDGNAGAANVGRQTIAGS